MRYTKKKRVIIYTGIIDHCRDIKVNVRLNVLVLQLRKFNLNKLMVTSNSTSQKKRAFY